MKLIKSIILFFSFALTSMSIVAQNASINILTHQAGIVKVGETVFLEVVINNTDADYPIPVYKLKPQISVPPGIVQIQDTGHVLPADWSIISNTKGVIKLSNGDDIISSGTARTILIALKGIAPGGPSTVSGNLLFSNGYPPGKEPGSATPMDNPADNSSTTTCKVIKK